jgi:hypothetical protein
VEPTATQQASESYSTKVAIPETPRKVASPVTKTNPVSVPKSRESAETPVVRRVVTPLARPPPSSIVETPQAPDTPTRKTSTQKSSDERNDATIVSATVTREDEGERTLNKGKESIRSDNFWAARHVAAKESAETASKPSEFYNEIPTSHEPSVQSFQRPQLGKLRTTTPPTWNETTVGLSNASQTSIPATSSGSQTSTPSVGDAPVRRSVQPRTLRITDTPKTETPPIIAPSPLTSAPVISSATGSKVSSRRPSLTSTAQPGTPVSERVEFSSVASASHTPSRATSPAPAGKKRTEKTKVKKQQQKKREDEEAIQLVPVEESSPILSRKKKSKKPGTVSTGPSRVAWAADNRSETPGEEETKNLNEEVETVKRAPLEETEEQPAKLPETPVEIQAPKPRNLMNVSDNIPLFENADFILPHPITNPVSMTGHLKNLPDTRPFSTSADFANYHVYHPDSQTPESRIPYNHPPKEPFTPEQYSTYIHTARLAGEPIRLSSRDGRLSGQYVETPRGIRLLGLTIAEQERLLQLETSICGAPSASFWGGGNVSYLPDVPVLKSRNKQYSTDEAQQLLLPPLQLPNGVVLLDPNREIAERDPASLVNQPLFATTNVTDPRIKGGEAISSPQPQQQQEFISSSTHPSRFYEHHNHPNHHGAGGNSSVNVRHISPLATAQPPPTDDAGRDPATASMFEKLELVEGGAKRAAAAIGGTHEILRRAIGTEDETVRWREQIEAEKRNALEIERRLNAVIKRNRKGILGGRA